MTEPASVLVADDDPVSRLMLTDSLERDGHMVLTAEDGAQALVVLRSRRVDLILLDVLMPKMDGYGVLERLKEDDDLRHTQRQQLHRRGLGIALRHRGRRPAHQVRDDTIPTQPLIPLDVRGEVERAGEIDDSAHRKRVRHVQRTSARHT